MAKCIILSGIPCSGKNYFLKHYPPMDYQGYKLPVLSCDDIREELFGKKYKQNRRDEERVWDVFVYKLVSQTSSFIVNNTNTKQKYLDQIKRCLYPGDPDKPITWEIEIKKFDCPLYLAYIRNIWRYCHTGKWIPFKVINKMKKNYDILHK